jgi:hypothetical protein
MTPFALHRFVALALAGILFLFETELNHDEEEQNHRQLYSTLSIAAPSVTWETFDKQNAPQAFAITVDRGDCCLLLACTHPPLLLPPTITLHPVRDKSPPFSATIGLL